MNIFEMIILSIVLILFPLFCYLFYIVTSKNISEVEKSMFLKFVLIVLFYLITRYVPIKNDVFVILLTTIPLYISYQRKYTIVTLLFIATYLLIYSYDYYLFFILINLLMFIYRKRNNSFECYLFTTIVITILFTLFIDFNNLFLNMGYLLIYLSIANIVVYTITIGEEAINDHIEYKNLKKEHEVRLSLFKITHEIRNPLAVIKAYIDMFDFNDVKCTKKYVPIIANEVDKVLLLLQDFLLVNKDNLNFDVMDINLLIEEVTYNIKELNKVDINLDLLDDELYINGDYNRLSQVITNLIKNSFEADASMVIIKTYIEDNNVILEVSDDGEGIIDKEKIYEPFYTTKKEGTGLGVSLSKEIVEAHSGVLKYFDNANKGTIAKILLPIIDM